MINNRYFLAFCFSILVFGCYSQKYSQNISADSPKISGKSLSGFNTLFDFSEKEINQGWWKYSKQYGLPRNQRTHYEVTIPASKDSKPLTIYSSIESHSSGTLKFRVGIEVTGMTESDKETLLNDLKDVLLDFKRWFYLREYQNKLSSIETAFPSDEANIEKWKLNLERRAQIIELMKRI